MNLMECIGFMNLQRDGPHNYLFRLIEISLNGYIRRFHDRPLRSIEPETLEMFIITEVLSPGTSAPAAGEKKTKKQKKA